MTPSELNRKISEIREPKPTLPPRFSNDESPLRGWKCKFVKWGKKTYPPNQDGYPEPEYIWVECDWIGDETKNAVLLDEMLTEPEIGLHLMMRDEYVHLNVFRPNRPTISGRDGGDLFKSADRKTAVAIAWLACEAATPGFWKGTK